MKKVPIKQEQHRFYGEKILQVWLQDDTPEDFKMLTDFRNGGDIRADNHSFIVFLFELDTQLIALLALVGSIPWRQADEKCES